MPDIRLIHWNEKEAGERCRLIRAAGYDVALRVPSPPTLLRELGRHPPSAIVIDLSRLPMQGRDIALAIRHRKATRNIPIVFVDGLPEKVDRAKKSLPDAVFTRWEKIAIALKRAITKPPSKPVVPQSVLAGYSGTPLPKKLGIKPSSLVVLVNAPRGFERVIDSLPEGAVLKRSTSAGGDLTLWFVTSQADVDKSVGRFARALGGAKMWIAWPKRASGVLTDLTEQYVREAGLAVGLVDFKICAIDATWSGLLFTRRKTQVEPSPRPR